MAWRRPFRHAEDILCVLKSEAFLPITSITDYPDSIRSTEKGEEASTLLGAIAAAAPDAKPVVVEDDIGGSDADAPTVAPMASRRRGRRGSRGGRGTRGLGQGRGATANVVTASARRTGAAVLCLEEDVEPSSIDEQDTMLAQEADESAKRHTDDNSDAGIGAEGAGNNSNNNNNEDDDDEDDDNEDAAAGRNAPRSPFEKSKCSFVWFEEGATYDVGKDTRRRKMKMKEVDAIATALAEALNEKAEMMPGRKPFDKAAIKTKWRNFARRDKEGTVKVKEEKEKAYHKNPQEARRLDCKYAALAKAVAKKKYD